MKFKFRAEPKDVLIFVIFCIFLLYLVAIAVLNLHYFATEMRFWGLNPFPAFGPEFFVTTIVFYILALVAAFLSVSSYFFEREKGFGYTKEKKEEKGFSRFLETKEIKQLKDVEKVVLSDSEYKSAGIPLILNEKEAYVDNGENHSLIIGGTGSGKTECVILPMVRMLGKKGESMIITDPKGEIYQKAGALLKEQGYNIILLNFRSPLNGNGWNPFSLPHKFYKEGKNDKAMEILEDLGANILIDPNNKNDPFWEQSSRDYFTGLSIGLFEDATDDQININSINMMATVGEEKFNGTSFEKEYFKSKGEMSSAYISANTTINAPGDTKGGIMSTFRTKTRMFSSRESLSEMLSHTDFDFNNIGKEKTAIFMIIHDEKKTYHSLATIFVKQVYEALIDVAFDCEGGRLPVRTNFLLDEFANMPALKDVDAMITASRSRNIRFNFIIQNFSQLNQVYGADMAETIKGNCGNIHFLTTTELKALEEMSKLCGDAKPKAAKEGKAQDPIRPLVTISDLQQLKKFEFLIKRLRSNPFKSKFTPDFELKQKNAWNSSYDLLEFPKREPKNFAIFDMKEFVKAKKKEELMKMFGDDGEIPESFDTPKQMIPPFPGMPMPGMGMGPSSLNVDDFIKKIDERIAEIEAEEKREQEKKTGIVESEISEPIIEETKKEKVEETNAEEEQEKEKDKLEKPKVNIDADSIIVDNNMNDDDFFDDFFDDEEE